ncbi:MAG: hypothetical protein COA70_09010 [Planctomycetota bacterium]|nr:MAG: hypothetical protein COA70_09010 [Planctomycetota bacterium]
MTQPSKHLRAVERPNTGLGERELLDALHALNPPPDPAGLVPRFPWKMQVQTFSRCNAACAMCPWPETKNELDQGRMEETTFRALLQQSAGQGLERMSLFLHNEPLLDVRLSAWTRMAKDILPETKLTIYTNGWLFTPEKAQELADAGMDEINVSVLAADAGLVEKYSPGTPLEKILGYLDGVSKLTEAGSLGGMKVSVAALDLPGVMDSFAPMEQRWADRGMPLYFAPVSNRAGNCEWGEGAGERRVVCQRPFTKAYVLYDGRLILCNCDWRREIVLGNIRETPLAELWQGEAYQALRTKLLREDLEEGFLCTACDYPYRSAEEADRLSSVEV